MYTPNEIEALEKLNYRRIREMIHVAWIAGYNMKKPMRFDVLFKILTIVLMVLSVSSYYAHWQLFINDIYNIPAYSESVSTVFQNLIALAKMTYFLLAPRKFYMLLRRACRHSLLQESELWGLIRGLPIEKPLREEIDEIMKRCWISKRRQLLFYLTACSSILANYFFSSIIITFYRYLKAEDRSNFEVTLPLPALYPGWMDRGMSFPYYYVPMVLEATNIYVCGMGTLGFDVLFVVLSLHGVGLMESLCHMIECSTSELVPPEKRVEYMRCCIYQYQRVAAYALQLNNTFRHMIIINFMFSLFCWGLILFQMSVGLATSIATTLRTVMYLSAGGYQIFIYCYNGQRFATASELIPKAFYHCLWYSESREFRQLTRMMLTRSNQSFSLDVSYFTKMALPTYLAMLRTSGQYVLLLQNLTQK